MIKILYVMLMMITITACCAMVNYGSLFYDENIYNPKLINKPDNCINLESNLSDSLKTQLYHVRYYQVGNDQFAMYFIDTEDNYDNKKMSRKGISYLVIVDKNCEIIKVAQEPLK